MIDEWPALQESIRQGWEDLQAFLERRDQKENIDFAIQMFAGALELDNTFALAYAGMGEAYWLKYQATRDSRWVERAIAASGLENLDGKRRTLQDWHERTDDKKKAELAKKDDAESKAELKQLETRDTIGPPDFDALLLPEGAERLFSIAPLLPYFDINPAEVHILGTSLWEGSGALSEPALAGAWCVRNSSRRACSSSSRVQRSGATGPPFGPGRHARSSTAAMSRR